ncbi:MAG: sulfatase-like hydrolase/transferase, partial [Bacteroidota bacterium]
LILFSLFCNLNAQDRPNILIIITDDMGIDAMSVYGVGAEQPHTPELNALLSQGILFNNAWGYAKCSPSRATILTGRYGNKNGVMRAGPTLPDSETTIFEHLQSLTSNAYNGALFGKWHLGDAQTPNAQGVDHFVGYMGSGVGDYYHWNRNENGVTDTISEYVTTHLTNQAIDWIDAQNQPWLVWMAYAAPKGDYLPPDSLYTRSSTSSSLDRFLCRIEAVDHEIGRLYRSLTPAEQANTFIVFVGDNGTGNSNLQGFPRRHGKNTIYEGGIRLPMFVTGYGVNRSNVQEDALVSFTDIFATVTEMLGEDLPGGVDNSFSFFPLLTDPNAPTRAYNYSELDNEPDTKRAIRNDQYKLIVFPDGTKAFYDLSNDPLEENELYSNGLDLDQIAILAELETEMDDIYLGWSCQDGIENGDESGIDCGGTFCNPCPNSPTAIFAHYFESGWDGWTSGGSDCTYHTGAARAYEGEHAIRIRDNSGIASSMTSEIFDLSAYNNAEIKFHFQAVSMETNESFFFEINTGSGWQVLKEYVSGSDFTNGPFYEEVIALTSLSATTSFRFTCNASNNQDRIFIDAITLNASLSSNRSIRSNNSNVETAQVKQSSLTLSKDLEDTSIWIYPNPVSDILQLHSKSTIEKVQVWSLDGRQKINTQVQNGQLNVANLEPGIYLVVFQTEKGTVRKRFVKQ